jgi:hypothetical protein
MFYLHSQSLQEFIDKYECLYNKAKGPLVDMLLYGREYRVELYQKLHEKFMGLKLSLKDFSS